MYPSYIENSQNSAKKTNVSEKKGNILEHTHHKRRYTTDYEQAYEKIFNIISH